MAFLKATSSGLSGAIQAGRIIYVGTDEGANAYIGKQTKVIDLHGRMVLPGFVDTHNHAIAGGAQLLDCDLSYAPLTLAQFQQKIQACLDGTRAKEPDGYLTVVGWYRQAMQPSGTEVTKADLDAPKTRRPIIVRSTDGHTTLGNSRALALAKITRNSPDPHAGRIDRDGRGEPTGIFEDSAEGLISQPMPTPTAADTLKAAEGLEAGACRPAHSRSQARVRHGRNGTARQSLGAQFRRDLSGRSASVAGADCQHVAALLRQQGDAAEAQLGAGGGQRS